MGQRRGLNTKFFHAQVKKRNHTNHISGIWINGSWISEPSQVKQAFAKHFEARFKATNDEINFKLRALQLPRITMTDAISLETMFSKSEISIALEEIDANKAPGPDYFNAGYIKFMWEQLHHHFDDFIHNFHRDATILTGINSSFLALIPKVTTPLLISDFRPISLINMVMKILLKIIANRIQVFLPKLVEDEQSAFIKGR